MLISSTTNPYASQATASASNSANIRRSDAAFAALFSEETPQEILKKIAGNGIEGMLKWRIDQMKKQIAEEVMASKGLTVDDIAALPPEERLGVQKQIMDEVAQRLKEAIQEEMQKQARGKDTLDVYDARSGGAIQSIDLLV